MDDEADTIIGTLVTEDLKFRMSANVSFEQVI